MSQLLDRTTAPAVRSIPRLHLPPVGHITLDNGARLTVLDAGDLDVTEITVAVDGGLIESPLNGLYMIAPELALEGTAGYTGSQIADMMDFNGASLEAQSHLHHLTTSIKALTSKFDNLLPVLAEIINCPTYPDDSIKAIAEKAAARVALLHERITFQASRGLTMMMKGPQYPSTLYVSPDNIMSITREQLVDYHKTALDTGHINIFAAGRVTPALVATINHTLGQISSTGPGYDVNFMPGSPQPRHVYNYVKEDTMQSAVAIGLPSIGRLDDDYIPLRLAVHALGGYFGSRLMKNIREDKGLTYGIGAALVGGPEGSTIEIMTETDNSYVDRVIDEVKAEMEKIKDPSTFNNDEIERFRRYNMSSLASLLDSPFTIMHTYANSLFSGTPADYFDRQQDAVAHMSAESLAATARRYFDTSNLYISVAGIKYPVN